MTLREFRLAMERQAGALHTTSWLTDVSEFFNSFFLKSVCPTLKVFSHIKMLMWPQAQARYSERRC